MIKDVKWYRVVLELNKSPNKDAVYKVCKNGKEIYSGKENTCIILTEPLTAYTLALKTPIDGKYTEKNTVNISFTTPAPPDAFLCESNRPDNKNVTSIISACLSNIQMKDRHIRGNFGDFDIILTQSTDATSGTDVFVMNFAMKATENVISNITEAIENEEIYFTCGPKGT